MSAYLLDTNALVYHYEGDPLGRTIDTLLRTPSNRFYVTGLTLVEIRSALAKRVRSADLSLEGYQLVMRGFLRDISSIGRFRIHPLRHRFVDPCVRLLEEYALHKGFGLHTLDCLHLRAALDLKEREPDLQMVTADRVLANISVLAGISTVLLAPPDPAR